MKAQTMGAPAAVRLFAPAANAALALLTLTALVVTPLSAQPGRITGPIDDSRTAAIPGHLNPRALAGTDRGQVEAAFPLNDLVITLKPSDEQQAALEAFLASQQDPASSDFHNWLTPVQFAERFGPTRSDLDKIAAWLEAQGFTVPAIATGNFAASRNWIAFRGTAEVAQRAFGVEIHRYLVAGQSHFATATEPRVPAAFAGLIAGFRGLDDFLPQAPHAKVHAAYTSGSGNHYLAPDDAATIYNFNTLYKNGFDGTGQTVAVIGQSAVNLSDIDNFRSIFNLPKNDPRLVTVPNLAVPGIVSGDVIESDLDLEWAGAVAKSASVIFVYSTNVFNALQYAVTDNLAPVISSSYGTCETGASAEGTVLRSIAQQANAQGITLLSASGDTGAFGCDASSATVATDGVSVTLPASIPEVTAVGGTQFNEGSGTYWSTSNNANDGSALSYIPEAGWNETANGGGLGASGGGASTLFSKPAWQAGPGVPADGARDVPDVAMEAGADHDGVIICTGGGCANGLFGGNGSTGASVVGGTSVATPVLAGIVALLNHYQVKTGALSKAGLGNINPTLYPLAQNYGDAFHDVTTGNSVVPCRAGTAGCATGSFGYQAGPGYDQVTGLGSVNAYALVTDWSLIKAAPLALSSVTASPSSVAGGATVTITATLTAAAPSGGVTVTLSGGTSALPLPASIVVPAGQFSAGVNVIAGNVTASTAITVTAKYSSVVKTASVTIVPVVLPSLSSVSVSPASVAGGSSATLTVTLSAAAPTSGATVTLTSSSTAFPVPASVAVPAGQKTASVTVQASAVTASASATVTAKYNGGTETTSITITPVVLPSLSSVAVSGTSVSGGTAVTLIVTLSAVAPAGGATITLTSNNSTLPVPASIVVPAGAKSASVSVQTSAVTASTMVTITAKYNGVAETASVTITPVVSPSLSSLTIAPATLTGGASTFLTIQLSGAAPQGGASVKLSSNSTSFPVPASATVPAGVQDFSLLIGTAAVKTSTPVTVTATYNGGSHTATATLTPVVIPTLTAVSVSPASLKGGSAATLIITLSGPAPPSGTVIALTSSNAAFPLPANVEMPPGGVLGSLQLQTKAVTASTTVTITASAGGTTHTATVTLTH